MFCGIEPSIRPNYKLFMQLLTTIKLNKPMNRTIWRILRTCLLYTCMLTVLLGCGKEPENEPTPSDGNVPVQSVSLNHTTLTLEQGQNSVLKATVSPSNATKQAVQWTSDNTSVATVNEGLVTALKAGTAKITVKTDDGGKTATCTVTVKASTTPSVTNEADKITAISAQLHGKANLGTSVSSDLAMGIMWSKESGVLPSNSKRVEATNMDKENNYSVSLISLEPETTYYYRSYVSQNGKDELGEIKEFTTKALSTLIETLDAKDIGLYSATLTGKLNLTDVPGVMQYGFYYGTDKKNLDKSIVGKEISQNTLSVDVNDLDSSKEYGYKVWVGFTSGTIGYKGRLHFKLDWTGDVKTVTVTESMDAAQSPNGAATKWLWIGNAGLVGLYETSSGIHEITLDVDTDWGFLVRTDPNTWDRAKWGSSGKSLGFGVPFPLLNSSNAGDITFSGGREYCGEAKSFATDISIKSINLNKYSLNMAQGDSETLIATVEPDNATNKSVEWVSQDTSVATVDANGKVTAVSEGETNVFARAKDGSIIPYTTSVVRSGYCKVTVTRQPVTSLQFSKPSLVIYKGESWGRSEQMSVTVSPSDASKPRFTLKSSDESIASCSGTFTSGERFYVYGNKTGKATITATANDGFGATASCEVEVRQYVTSIKLNRDTKIEIRIGEEYTFSVASILPEDAYDKTVTWSSDGPYLSVDQSGKVTGEYAGPTVVRAKANDGSGVYAECVVWVIH